MKKSLQKIVTVLGALALALIAFPSGVYADIAPEPPIPVPSDGPGGAAGIAIVVLVIAVAVASVIILKKIKKK